MRPLLGSASGLQAPRCFHLDDLTERGNLGVLWRAQIYKFSCTPSLTANSPWIALIGILGHNYVIHGFLAQRTHA